MATREVNDATVDLIKRFEGIPDGNPKTVNLDPYLDPVGIWTVGWGHAITMGNDFVRGKSNEALADSLYPGGITREQAEALLRTDLMDTGKDVLNIVTVDLNDNQYGALVGFAFNLGLGNLRKSTLLRLLNIGDYDDAADEFAKWNRAGGKLLKGLTARRNAERDLFLTQV
ncbi:MAG: lysozyme [Burkholderiaceae bacterium]